MDYTRKQKNTLLEKDNMWMNMDVPICNGIEIPFIRLPGYIS